MQYSTLNIKLLNSQLNYLKSEIKIGNEVTLNLSSNVIGNCYDDSNFPPKLLLTNTRVSRICKAFANGSSANIESLKPQSSIVTVGLSTLSFFKHKNHKIDFKK